MKAFQERIDPARGATGFHDAEVNFVAFEDSGEVCWVSCRGYEPVLASRGIKEAAHGVEFAEVKSENLHLLSVREFGGWKNVTDRSHLAASRVRVASLVTKGSHPSHLRLTWIFFVEYRSSIEK